MDRPNGAPVPDALELYRSGGRRFDGSPGQAVREFVANERFRFHLDAVAWLRRWDVMTAAHGHRIQEVFMEVVYVFDDTIFRRATDGDVIEDGKVLDVFAQADASGVRTNRDAKLRGEQEHRENFVHTAKSGSIDLAESNGVGLHELLEHDPVLAMLARGHTDAERLQFTGDGGVTEHIVRAGRLLDPPRFEGCEVFHPGDGLRHVPDLIRVGH